MYPDHDSYIIHTISKKLFRFASKHLGFKTTIVHTLRSHTYWSFRELIHIYSPLFSSHARPSRLRCRLRQQLLIVAKRLGPALRLNEPRGLIIHLTRLHEFIERLHT